MYTQDKNTRLPETPMFAPQLLCIYHLIVESSHYRLSLEPLRPSQHHTKSILELCCKFLMAATALRASPVGQCQSVPFSRRPVLLRKREEIGCDTAFDSR